MELGAIKLTIDSRYENVALLGTAINRICREAGLSAEAAFEVEVSVAEAVNNVIKHGYRSEAGHQIEVMLELTADAIDLRVSDAGLSIPPEKLQPHDEETGDPEAETTIEDLDDVAENGRGLFIILSLMNRVSYASTGGKNVLSLSRDLKAGTDAPDDSPSQPDDSRKTN